MFLLSFVVMRSLDDESTMDPRQRIVNMISAGTNIYLNG